MVAPFKLQLLLISTLNEILSFYANTSELILGGDCNVTLEAIDKCGGFPWRPTTLWFVALVILPPKSLLQSLCKQKYGWDEEMSNADSVGWHRWMKRLACLRPIAVPRCFKPPGFGAIVNAQLQHFSDASEYEYGAASYLRIVNDKVATYSSFVLGKSRVTP